MNFLTIFFKPHPPSFLTFLMSFLDISNQILIRSIVITDAEDDDDEDDAIIKNIFFQRKWTTLYLLCKEKKKEKKFFFQKFPTYIYRYIATNEDDDDYCIRHFL